MSDLKDQLIRLGHKAPELRDDLRPILAELESRASLPNRDLGPMLLEDLSEALRRSRGKFETHVRGIEGNSLEVLLKDPYGASHPFKVVFHSSNMSGRGNVVKMITYDTKFPTSKVVLKQTWSEDEVDSNRRQIIDKIIDGLNVTVANQNAHHEMMHGRQGSRRRATPMTDNRELSVAVFDGRLRLGGSLIMSHANLYTAESVAKNLQDDMHKIAEGMAEASGGRGDSHTAVLRGSGDGRLLIIVTGTVEGLSPDVDIRSVVTAGYKKSRFFEGNDVNMKNF